MIKIKRVYEQASEDDGIRILVDRLWPRGANGEILIKFLYKQIVITTCPL